MTLLGAILKFRTGIWGRKSTTNTNQRARGSISRLYLYMLCTGSGVFAGSFDNKEVLSQPETSWCNRRRRERHLRTGSVHEMKQRKGGLNLTPLSNSPNSMLV